jgi:hypothetical protein
MPGRVVPARPKPLRRGEGPGIHVVGRARLYVDGRDLCASTRFALLLGHDGEEWGGGQR